MYWSCWCSLSVGEITSSPGLMLSAFHHRKWQAALLSERCNVSCGGKSLHNWNQLFLLSVMKSHEQVLKGWCHRWTANHCICEAKHYWAPHRVLKSIVGFSVVRITYGCFWQKQQHPSWCAGFSHREVTVSVFTSHSEKYPLHPPTPNLTLSLSSARSLLRSLPMFLYVQKQNLLTVLEETNETSPPGSAFAAPYSREPICPENPAVSAVS